MMITNRTINWMGDSMVFGTGASKTSLRFTTLASVGKYYNEINKGIGGSKITDLVNTTIPQKVLPGDILVYNYITNDCQAITTTQYNSAFQTSFNYAVASRGYDMSDIYVIRGIYYDDTNPNNTFIDPSNYDPFLSAIDELKSSNPVINLVPLYDLMTTWVASNPSFATLLNVASDGVHLTDRGHLLAAEFFKLYI